MDNIEVVVGTYENLLIGYSVVPNQVDKSQSPALETSFTDDSHRGALRCVAVSASGLLASSSTDDSIRLHSLKKRKEIGSLFEHRGTVNSMVFYDNNHMFSASEDGTICLWKTKNWELMRTLKGHKAQVMAVAIHPSGKLGLSVGSDRSFLTWDLLTGKLAFQRKIADVAQKIFFTPNGDHYVLVFNKKIEVCMLADTKVVMEIPTEWRINTVCHVEDNIFAIGGDDRNVKIVDVLTGTQLMALDAGKRDEEEFRSRVRCVCVLTQEEDVRLLILATASGNVKAFRLDLSKRKAKELLFCETRVRVTAMGVYSRSSTCDNISDTNGTAAAATSKKSSATVTEDNVPQAEADQSDVTSESSDGGETDQSDDSPAPRPKKRKLQQDPVKQTKEKKKQKLPKGTQSSKSDSFTLKTKTKKKDVTQMQGGVMHKKMKTKRKNK